MSMSVQLAVDGKAIVGEGTCWDAQKQILYWVDILGKKVHLFDPSRNENRSIELDQYVGAVVPTTSKDGELLVALHHGLALLDPATSKLTPIVDPESHLPDNRFNDGKCDPAGRFFAGTMQLGGKSKTGALYRLDADLSVHKLVDSIGISNGLAWSADHRTMYYVDTKTAELWAFDYDIATGAIANRRTAIAFSGEFIHPDGMTIDEDDMLWIAFYDGGCVARWDPVSGAMLDVIRLPVTLTTNCAFGGPRLDTLYVTSCRVGLSDEQLKSQPHAGGLFYVKPGVRGLAAPPFHLAVHP